MQEENKPKSYEEIHKENQQKDEDRRVRMENVRQQTLKRLHEDPAIQEYFAQYNPHGIESFISGYASWKSIFTEYGGVYEGIAETHYTEYFERAANCIKEIQLKKLFHLRCEWGANLIALDGIETTWDFLVWSGDVLNCPLLPQITADEFEQYLEYAKSDQFRYDAYFNWLEVDATDSGSRENIDYNEWFHYNNTHTDAGKYLALPDIRGEQELFYRRLWSKEQEELREQKYESGEVERPVPELRPLLSQYNRAQLMDFLKRFEEAETVRLFENYEQYGNRFTINEDDDNSTYLDEKVEEIIVALASMKEVRLPVEANPDWRQALLDAWDKFENEQTVAHLPAAYNDYLFRIENQIQFETDETTNYKTLAESVRVQILRGRELNGEPADFNF